VDADTAAAALRKTHTKHVAEQSLRLTALPLEVLPLVFDWAHSLGAALTRGTATKKLRIVMLRVWHGATENGP
jgi:hypothetical protein